MSTETLLLDVCHCPAKDGRTATGVVQKQLARLNLSLMDIVSGTGDGGGENEGIGGVHQSIEDEQPSYVRRRCLTHIAWTICKQGLKETDCKVYESICTYLNSAQSTTWFQLKALAVLPREDGGLGLLTEGSKEYLAIFDEMPGTIVEDRPESVMNFLRFLRNKERVLAPCAAVDVVNRDLKAGALTASAALADVAGRVKRSIMAELLYRGLHLARYGNVRENLASDSRLEDLISEASAAILDVEITEGVLERFGASRAAVEALGARTWVEVAARLEFHATAECEAHMAEFLAFHQRVGGRMQAHILLRGEKHVANLVDGGRVGLDGRRQSTRRSQRAPPPYLNHLACNSDEV